MRPRTHAGPAHAQPRAHSNYVAVAVWPFAPPCGADARLRIVFAVCRWIIMNGDFAHSLATLANIQVKLGGHSEMDAAAQKDIHTRAHTHTHTPTDTHTYTHTHIYISCTALCSHWLAHTHNMKYAHKLAYKHRIYSCNRYSCGLQHQHSRRRRRNKPTHTRTRTTNARTHIHTQAGPREYRGQAAAPQQHTVPAQLDTAPHRESGRATASSPLGLWGCGGRLAGLVWH